jgi:dTDP-glucose 4,6-dehydratase
MPLAVHQNGAQSLFLWLLVRANEPKKNKLAYYYMAFENSKPNRTTLYEPKNILVTGGAGFIGSHVVIRLTKNYPQYKIVNLDKLDYCASLKNLDCIKDAPNYHFIKGDILSEDLVNYVISSHKIDTIMHFAAQTHVDNSFGNSIQFTKNNVLGTHVLLECAKVNKIRRFIHVSTDEVYGESSFADGVIENTMLQPTNPYAATKAGAEYLVKSYYKSFQLPTIITRGNNVYGPHQFPEKIIPKFIGLLHRKKPCYIHGTGEHKRSYLYVEDVARAFDIILHCGKPGPLPLSLSSVASLFLLSFYSVRLSISCANERMSRQSPEQQMSFCFGIVSKLLLNSSQLLWVESES